MVVRPLLYLFLALRSVWFFCWRVFFAEPLFKAYCKSYGRNFHTDIRLHWVMGKGDLIIGDDVTIDGLCTFMFASRFSDHPTLAIGDNCHISGGCVFVVAKSISIGSHCQIAGGVGMRDSDGHPVESAARRSGAPPTEDAIRPIVIEDNVWIGARATVSPGVRIGEGSIVSAGALVQTSVAPYTIVAGNPARKIGTVPRPADSQAAPSV